MSHKAIMSILINKMIIMNWKKEIHMKDFKCFIINIVRFPLTGSVAQQWLSLCLIYLANILPALSPDSKYVLLHFLLYLLFLFNRLY